MNPPTSKPDRGEIQQLKLHQCRSW